MTNSSQAQMFIPEWLLFHDERQQLQCLANHALIVEQGKILALGPVEKLKAQYQDLPVEHLPAHVLMPGFVNAHGHAAMSLFRGLADDLALMDWLQNHIWPAESRWVSEEFVYAGSQLAIAEMIKSGTTTFADMYFFSDQTAKAARESKINLVAYAPVLDFPTAWANDAKEYLAKAEALLQQSGDGVTFGLGPHAPYTVGDESFAGVIGLAEKYACPIQIHLYETAFEVASAIEQSGKKPLARLEQLGLLKHKPSLVHMTQVSADEDHLIWQNDCSVVHCPESNLKLASGICPTARLLAKGINVSLGTDGAASNNDLDLLAEARTAALLSKVFTQDASTLPAAQVLHMATLGGAKALGLEKQLGSLAVGKQADMIAIHLNELHLQPIYNPISQIVYAAKGSDVEHVWIRGEAVMRNKKLLTLNEQDILQNAKAWQQKISGAVNA